MKFIHTADWHLGNRMHDIERNEEFKSFLDWLKKVIVEENAEGLIVSGDIFDTATPPTESRRQYNRFLASLLGTSCRNVIIIGGNHDSGALLDSEKDILEALDIHVVGSISNLKIDEMVFELKDTNGDVSAICVAVPFVRENDLRDYFDEDVEEGCFSDRAYGALYDKALEAAKRIRGDRQIPIVATGHLYAANLEGRFAASDKESGSDDGRRVLDVVGKLGSVHASVFSSDYDYVALGHIHYTTMVDRNPKIRYSGSPFILGFDEAHLDRNVLCVSVEKGQKPEIKKIEVPRTVEYRRISGNCETIRQELNKFHSKEIDATTGKYVKSHLELYYKREDGININDELESLITELKEKEVFVASRRVQDVGKILNGENLYCDDMDELKNMAPEEIFKTLLLSRSHVDLEEEKEMSDEDKERKIKEKQDEIIRKYLPTFMEVYNSVLNGDM